MNWTGKTLKKHLKSSSVLVLLPISFVLILIIANQIFWWHFDWKDIDYIEQPAPLVRLFYSALVYVTLGAFLYYIQFYRLLYSIFWYTKTYKDIKGAIWWSLMLLMYFIIVPWVVNILNWIISLFFNTYNFFLQSLPLLGMAFWITWIILAIYGYITKKDPFVLK